MKPKPRLADCSKDFLQVPLANNDHKSLPSPANSLKSCDSADAPTCWICMDDESTEVLLMNACGCKDRHVHGSCLASWVHRSQQHVCKACTKPWSPIFRPSEIISVVDFVPTEPSLPFHRHHDVACYSVSLMFSFGFAYGLLYTNYAFSVERQFLIAILSNACVVLAWNRICASPARRGNPHNALEDLCLMCGTYTFFLLGWITGFFVVTPNIQHFLYNGIPAHAWNFLTFCFVLSLRCFCLKRARDDGPNTVR